jgi:hypothetical protein
MHPFGRLLLFAILPLLAQAQTVIERSAPVHELTQQAPQEISSKGRRPARQMAAERARFDTGLQYVALLPGAGPNNGIGGWFAYNFTRRLGVETALDIYPGGESYRQFTITDTVASMHPSLVVKGHNALRARFGPKVTLLRTQQWMFSAKGRAGLLYAADSFTDRGTWYNGLDWLLNGPSGRQLDLSSDFGGIVEYELSGKMVLRTEVGATVDRFGSSALNVTYSNRYYFGLVPPVHYTVAIPAKTASSFQISTGLGFRF